jgi:SPP1 gp7 family putative phage head morphogenesis protein
MTTDFLLNPVPFQEAADFLASKPAIARRVFDQLLPELRARAFAVAGLSQADDLRSVRDAVATLPRGAKWNDVRDDVAGVLLTETGEDSTTAIKHAELVLRMQGFMAYSAAGDNLAQATKDELPYLMYNAMEDDRVRPEHAALDGLVLPVDDPFWAQHTPPWDWGCRCWRTQVSAPEYGRIKAGDAYGRVLGPVAHRRLLSTGELDDGAGHVITITTPEQRALAAGENPALAWHWTPGDLRIPLDGLRARYAADPLTWACFESFAKSENLAHGVSVWDWLNGAQL